MLRVILIVLISFVLAACRSGDDVSSTGGQSKQATSSTAVQTTATKSTTLSRSAPTDSASSQQSATTASSASSADPQQASPAVARAVTLEWTIPVQRVNGELLGASDLDGYIIEFVDQSDPDAVDQAYIEGGQSNSHSLSLPAGSYRFRVIAVDANGLTSAPSDWVNAKLA